MTPDHSPDPTAADIAWMRDLAEQGRDAPPVNGPFLVAASIIFGTANLFQWTIQSGLWVVDPMAQLWVWLAAGALFAAALFVLIPRTARKPGSGSHANKAIGSAWSGLGLSIFVMWLSLMAIGFSSGDWAMMWAMPSIVATAYGSAWLVSGEMSGRAWMKAVAVLAYAGAVVCGALIGDPAIYLAFAVIMLATALVPGLVLMRQEQARAA